ncbi:hypothetical protein ACFGVS_28020 [Mucilaginibacter sp. AW1-7]|jgi:hypothetical protein|uniref:hypothetical protein n=1 Tax=unclassified Mucilaginibacter TaxID=2617802 RepID=UPI0008CB5663|nr:hypothetical protein [Mucilaginibacter sp. OK283]SEP45948.1 hypothetical protein SAMN05428947_12422 [Mucilaginibacter sp. OK283]
MDQQMLKKIEQFKKLATVKGGAPVASNGKTINNDSLSQVIRSKKDADDFMAELEAVAKRAK